MPRKPTFEELKSKVKELESQLADLKEADSASKDFTAYQSVLADLRGVSSEETEESFMQTFLTEIVKEYGFCMSWYGRYEDGTIKVPDASNDIFIRLLVVSICVIEDPTVLN